MFKRLLLTLLAVGSITLSCIAVFATRNAYAQTLISGDIAGVIMDPSGAVIPKAAVTATEVTTGSVSKTVSTSDGRFHISLLKPGDYKVTVLAPGLSQAEVDVPVAVGKVAHADIRMQMGTNSETVVVQDNAAMLDTQNGDLTTSFDMKQIEDIPNPGNDITFVGQLAPGSVMNTSGGSGNFSSYGLPATSNNFTVNGVSQVSPWSNTNNSYAVNMLLGTNDLSEATVVTNAYSTQYGGLGGAQINELTRFGTNNFHGNAAYWWNDKNLNANNYFNNQQGIARPSEKAQQWAAAVGGPIFKNKTFFFVNTEGISFTAPSQAQAVYVPSQAFQSRVLAQVAQENPAETPFYQNLFKVYNAAVVPAGQTLRPYVNADPITGTPVTNTDINTYTFLSSVKTYEYILTARVDHNFSDRDKVYGHFRLDRGVQPSTIDPISSAFNITSTQPAYSGDMAETHNFGTSATNLFLFTATYSSQAYDFVNRPLALATFPYQFAFSDEDVTQNGKTLHYNDPLTKIDAASGNIPQGTNQTQYQFTDDFTKTKGQHTLKAGFIFIRTDATDLSPNAGTMPEVSALGDAYGEQYAAARGTGTYYNLLENGYASSSSAQFPTRAEEPFAFYQLGFYAQDSWQLTPSLTLNGGVRVERNSNPVCPASCTSRFKNDFFSTNQTVDTPYNSVIAYGQKDTFTNYQPYIVEPRMSFAWQPFGTSAGTVLRGGFGMFADSFPVNISNTLLYNVPTKNGFTANSQSLTVPNSPQYLIDPTQPGSGYSADVASNTAFVNGFYQGGTYTTISQAVAAAGSSLALPGFTSVSPHIYYPTYEEWNLQIEQQLGSRTTMRLGYNGNHGYHEPVVNNSADAWWNGALLPIPGQVTNTQTGNVFSFNPAGLPTAPPNQNFSSFTQISNAGISNYHGLTVDMTHRSHYLTLQASYNWSKAMDDVSNGGIFSFGSNSTSPVSPYNLRYNYGNADYDVRNNIKGSYIFDVPDSSHLKVLTNDWEIAGTVFWHSGFPFSVVDGFASGAFSTIASAPGAPYPYNSYNGQINAVPLNRSMNRHCGSEGIFNFATQTGGQCFGGVSAFTDPSGFGADDRNQYTGPGFFDTDMTVLKGFHIPRWEQARLQVGVQFFNILNHPNFATPSGDIAYGPNFGQITSTVSTPTSIFGAYLGGDASPRLIQLKTTFKF
jgi:hypothetical protein